MLTCVFTLMHGYVYITAHALKTCAPICVCIVAQYAYCIGYVFDTIWPDMAICHVSYCPDTRIVPNTRYASIAKLVYMGLLQIDTTKKILYKEFFLCILLEKKWPIFFFFFPIQNGTRAVSYLIEHPYVHRGKLEKA